MSLEDFDFDKYLSGLILQCKNENTNCQNHVPVSDTNASLCKGPTQVGVGSRYTGEIPGGTENALSFRWNDKLESFEDTSFPEPDWQNVPRNSFQQSVSGYNDKNAVMPPECLKSLQVHTNSRLTPDFQAATSNNVPSIFEEMSKNSRNVSDFQRIWPCGGSVSVPSTEVQAVRSSGFETTTKAYPNIIWQLNNNNFGGYVAHHQQEKPPLLDDKMIIQPSNPQRMDEPSNKNTAGSSASSDTGSNINSGNVITVTLPGFGQLFKVPVIPVADKTSNNMSVNDTNTSTIGEKVPETGLGKAFPKSGGDNAVTQRITRIEQAQTSSSSKSEDDEMDEPEIIVLYISKKVGKTEKSSMLSLSKASEEKQSESTEPTRSSPSEFPSPENDKTGNSTSTEKTKDTGKAQTESESVSTEEGRKLEEYAGALRDSKETKNMTTERIESGGMDVAEVEEEGIKVAEGAKMPSSDNEASENQTLPQETNKTKGNDYIDDKTLDKMLDELTAIMPVLSPMNQTSDSESETEEDLNSNFNNNNAAIHDSIQARKPSFENRSYERKNAARKNFITCPGFVSYEMEVIIHPLPWNWDGLGPFAHLNNLWTVSRKHPSLSLAPPVHLKLQADKQTSEEIVNDNLHDLFEQRTGNSNMEKIMESEFMEEIQSCIESNAYTTPLAVETKGPLSEDKPPTHNGLNPDSSSEFRYPTTNRIGAPQQRPVLLALRRKIFEKQAQTFEGVPRHQQSTSGKAPILQKINNVQNPLPWGKLCTTDMRVLSPTKRKLNEDHHKVFLLGGEETANITTSYSNTHKRKFEEVALSIPGPFESRARTTQPNSKM